MFKVCEGTLELGTAIAAASPLHRGEGQGEGRKRSSSRERPRLRQDQY